MMRFLFDFIFFLYTLIYLPYLLLKGKWHAGLWQRWGNFSPELTEALRSSKNIWLHAVSVGEVMAVGTLLEELKKSYSSYQYIISTVTSMGYTLATEKFGHQCHIIYAPFDLSWVVRKYIRQIQPVLYVLAETEIWPNLLLALFRRKIPVVLINGRISPKAYRRYHWVRFFLRPVVRPINQICAQSETDKERFIKLGADPEKVCVVGNLKFDVLLQAAKFPEDLRFNHGSSLLVAGSTHPGEEEILLEMFKALHPQFPSLQLVLAPRHPQRSAQVCELVSKENLQPVKFSETKNGSLAANRVLVVDTIGNLHWLYSLAQVVFVGKSFRVGGGHNIIEPAFFGKPILVGPMMENFREILETFLRNQAVIQVKDENELLVSLRQLLSDPAAAAALGDRARAVVKNSQGATQKTVDVLSRFLA